MSWTHSRRADDALLIVRTIVDETRSKNVPFMAGSIAYSAFVSLLPLLLLLLLVASALGGRLLADRIVEITGTYLSPTGKSLLADAITHAYGSAGLSLLGILVLVWGTLRVFRGLDTAFSVLYETGEERNLDVKIRDVIVVLVAIDGGLLLVVGAGAVFALFSPLPTIGLLGPVLLTVGLTLAFLPIYYVLPDAHVSVREVFPGAVLAAVGWTVLESVFEIYVAFSSTIELYGLMGGFVLLITWLYFGALVLLVGTVTNVVLAGRTRTTPAGAQTEPY